VNIIIFSKSFHEKILGCRAALGTTLAAALHYNTTLAVVPARPAAQLRRAHINGNVSNFRFLEIFPETIESSNKFYASRLIKFFAP
jgi:ribose 5-phosphate isomerase RpiB